MTRGSILHTPEMHRKQAQGHLGVSTAVATSAVATAMSEQEVMDLILPVSDRRCMAVGDMNYVEFCEAMERLLIPLSRKKRTTCCKRLFGNPALNLDHSDVRWWVIVEMKKLGVKLK